MVYCGDMVGATSTLRSNLQAAFCLSWCRWLPPRSAPWSKWTAWANGRARVR